MNKNFFSLDNFKKWIDEQETQEENQNTENVRPTIGVKKLISKISIEEGNIKEVCKDFFENGGRVKGQEDKNLLIEVSAGSFYLHRIFTEKA